MTTSSTRRLGLTTSALAVATAGLMLGAAPAFAQDGEVTTFTADTIIVTARRVAEDLQDIPIAVTAIGAEQLERQGISSVTDVANRTVGFALESLSGPLTQPSIRGQLQLRTTSPVQNVATYFDGVYLQRGYMIDQSLVELERVEIIKGPQSALYGRNAFAGAINIVTKDPSLTDIGATAKVTIGTDERLDYGGSFSLPIVQDRLAVMFSYQHSEFDGTWENNHPLANADGANTKGNLGGYDNDSYMFKVVAKPMENLRLEGLYVKTERLVESRPSYNLNPIGLTNPVDQLNASFVNGSNRLYVGELPVVVPVTAGSGRPEGYILDPRSFGQRGPTEIYSIAADWDVSDNLVASYQYGKTKAKIEARGSSQFNPLIPLLNLPFPPFNLVTGVNFDSSGFNSTFEGDSHEVRLDYTADRMRIMVGANYSETQDLEANASELAPLGSLEEPPTLAEIAPGVGPSFPSFFGGLLSGAFPDATRVASYRTLLQREEEIISFFGFASYDLTDQFTLTAEVRYTDEDQTATDFLTVDPNNPALQNPNPPVLDRSSSFFTPRVTATYRITPDNMVYANVARGVKSGGVNGFVAYVPQRLYDDETNWTFEVGSKNLFFDRKFQFNFAAYYTSWRGLQNNAAGLRADGTLAPAPASVSSVTGNLGGVNVLGFEVDGFYRLTPELRLSYGFTYNRSRYTDASFSDRMGIAGNCNANTVCSPVLRTDELGNTFPTVPIGGNSLERTPEMEAMFAIDYDREISADLDYYFRGDVNWQSKQYAEELNLSFVPARALVNASTGITYKNFDVRIWATNLLNKKYINSSLAFFGAGGALAATYAPYAAEQRTVGVTASFKY